MTDNQKKILEMLADKKISVDEAQRLLSLVEPETDKDTGTSELSQGKKSSPKYLRVVVHPGEGSEKAERVNVRVPMSLIHAGIKLTYLIPPPAVNHMNEALKEKGVDFDLRNIKPEDLEQLVDALSDLEVDVESGKEKVRVYVE